MSSACAQLRRQNRAAWGCFSFTHYVQFIRQPGSCHSTTVRAPAPMTTRKGEPRSRAQDGVSAGWCHVTSQQSDLQLLTRLHAPCLSPPFGNQYQLTSHYPTGGSECASGHLQPCCVQQGGPPCRTALGQVPHRSPLHAAYLTPSSIRVSGRAGN